MGFLLGLGVLGVGVGYADDAVQPTIFQAAGLSVESIQSSLDAFRAALGEPNNRNNPGPFTTGRREINWDGGGSVDITTDPVTPFNVFLDTRGGLFTTPGIGLSQAPPSGGPQGGLAGLFHNPTYGEIYGSLSFFGIVVDDARIAWVRISSGNVAPGPDDDAKNDIVVAETVAVEGSEGEHLRATRLHWPALLREGFVGFVINPPTGQGCLGAT